MTRRLTKRLTGWQKELRVERDSLVVSGATKTTGTTGAAGGTRTTETTGGTMALTFRFLCVVGCSFFVVIVKIKFN